MTRLRSIPLAAAAVALLLTGADTPVQTISAGGIKFNAPEGVDFQQADFLHAARPVEGRARRGG